MAADVVELMRRLGQRRFGVVGHDRGSAVAYRLALDQPESVTKLAVLDCIPIGEHLARADARFALAWWHWFFFAQMEKPAERFINADPAAWYENTSKYMGSEAYAGPLAGLRDPNVVHGMIEDYRAGVTVDREADDADRAAGRRIELSRPCRMVDTRRHGRTVRRRRRPVWRAWANEVRGVAIDSGHHVAEEAPEALAAALLDFF